MILANTSRTYHSEKICLHHLGGRDHSPCNDIGLFLRQIAHKWSRSTEKKDTSKYGLVVIIKFSFSEKATKI